MPLTPQSQNTSFLDKLDTLNSISPTSPISKVLKTFIQAITITLIILSTQSATAINSINHTYDDQLALSKHAPLTHTNSAYNTPTPTTPESSLPTLNQRHEIYSYQTPTPHKHLRHLNANFLQRTETKPSTSPTATYYITVLFLSSSVSTQPNKGLHHYKFRHYSPELGRWPSRDPIEEDGGVNLYGFVGNDPVGRWDALGLVIESECPINKELTALGVTYEYEELNGVHIYREGELKNDNEILRTMIKFEHTFGFEGDTVDKCWNKILKHVKAREGIITRSKKMAKGAKFGRFNPNNVNQNDVIKNPWNHTYLCGEALMLALWGSNPIHVRSSYFIPGNGGYIVNSSSANWGGKDADNLPTRGENIVYLGGGKFYGHVNKVEDRTQTLNQWLGFVDKWGKSEMTDEQWVPLPHVDYFNVNKKFLVNPKKGPWGKNGRNKDIKNEAIKWPTQK